MQHDSLFRWTISKWFKMIYSLSMSQIHIIIYTDLAAEFPTLGIFNVQQMVDDRETIYREMKYCRIAAVFFLCNYLWSKEYHNDDNVLTATTTMKKGFIIFSATTRRDSDSYRKNVEQQDYVHVLRETNDKLYKCREGTEILMQYRNEFIRFLI